MGVHAGPADWWSDWTANTDAGRDHIATQNIVQNGLLLNLDAGVSRSYPGTGTTWTDLSGNNNNGTLTNGPTYSANNGGYIDLDGTNDYVACGTYTGLGSSSRSVDLWFSITSFKTSGQGRVFTLVADDGSTDNPALLLSYTTTANSVNFGMGGGPYDGYIYFTNFPLNTWYHMAGTVTGNTISVYVNGTLFATDTNSGVIGANPIAYIGRYNNYYGQYGNCRVSQFRIYNRALTAAEVLQNFNATRGRFGI